MGSLAINSLKITPDSPFTNDTLKATVTAVSPNGAAVTYTYQWQRTRGGKTTTLTATGDTISAAGTAIEMGDVVSVTVVAKSGNQTSLPVSTSVTIKNSPISIRSFTLQPKTPYTFEKMIATVKTDDADRTQPYYSFTWTKNGVTVRTVTNSRNSQDFYDLNGSGRGDKGDTIAVTVVVSDGETTATAKGSSTIRNSIPVLSQLTLSPQAPATTSTLTSTYSGRDADGDSMTKVYKWKIGTKVLVDERSSSLNLAKYPFVKAGDVVSLEMRLSDGTSLSKSLVASVTVASTSTTGAAATPVSNSPSPGSGNAS